MAAEQLANVVTTTLATAIDASQTSLVVASATGYPTSGTFRILIDLEILTVTSVSGTLWTVTRGAEGSAAIAHSAGTTVRNILSAGGLTATINDAAAQSDADPLVNRAFQVWQDGTTFSSIASGTWGPDNWVYAKSGAVVHDLLRSTDVPTVAQAGARIGYSCHLDVTTADIAIAAGDYCTLATRIEGYRFANLDQQAFTFPVWVKAAKTGVHYVYARNSGNDRSVVVAYTINVADTWELKTITIPANPSAGTWDYTNGRGLEIGFTLACGSTYQVGGAASVGVWQTGDYKGYSDQVNETDATANNFRVAAIGRPVVGATAVPFTNPDLPVEEYRTKRYNECWGGVNNSMFASGTCESTTIADFALSMVPKRAGGLTIGALSGTIGNLGLLVKPASSAIALTALSDLSSSSPDKPFLRATVASGLTAGEAAILYASGSDKLRIQSRIP